MALGLHYAWYLGLVFSWLPPHKAALFVLLSQMFAGFLLSIVFVQVCYYPSLAKAPRMLFFTDEPCGGDRLSTMSHDLQSHNAMEVYINPKDFISAQVVSTRDITSSLWHDWFTGEHSRCVVLPQRLNARRTDLNLCSVFAGGLNYQIEHHLFPTLPRHNLSKVRGAVMELCRRHGLAYESCGMAAGTAKVLRHLADIAAQA